MGKKTSTGAKGSSHNTHPLASQCSAWVWELHSDNNADMNANTWAHHCIKPTKTAAAKQKHWPNTDEDSEPDIATNKVQTKSTKGKGKPPPDLNDSESEDSEVEVSK